MAPKATEVRRSCPVAQLSRRRAAPAAFVFKDDALLAFCERPLATFAEAWPPLAQFDTVDIEKESRDQFNLLNNTSEQL